MYIEVAFGREWLQGQFPLRIAVLLKSRSTRLIGKIVYYHSELFFLFLPKQFSFSPRYQ